MSLGGTPGSLLLLVSRAQLSPRKSWDRAWGSEPGEVQVMVGDMGRGSPLGWGPPLALRDGRATGCGVDREWGQEGAWLLKP